MAHTPALIVVHHDRSLHLQLQPIARALGIPFHAYLNGETFLSSHRIVGCECVASDFRLLDMAGLDLLRKVRERSQTAVFVFISDAPEVAHVVQAIKSGAADVLMRASSEMSLAAAISAAISEAQRRYRVDEAHSQQQQLLQTLSEKERDVLDLMLTGLPNKVIARRLSVSLRTVEVRRQQIFKKTQTKSVAELVRMVICGK
ncbi:MAG: response regulator [Planctomycetales bacterium]|nr:response regulator [Planctomycetales bacterium]